MSATLQPDVIVCIVYIDVYFQLLPSSANMCLCVHVRACMRLRVARACVRICVRARILDVYCTRTNMLSRIDIQLSCSISPPSLSLSISLPLSPYLARAISLYLSFPHFLSISLSVFHSPSLPLYISLSPAPSLSLSRSLSISVSPTLSPYISLYFTPPLSHYISPSPRLSLSLSPSLSLSIYLLYLYLTFSLSLTLSPPLSLSLYLSHI